MTATETTDDKTAAHFARPPVRRGDVYCSPWCGGGCTVAAHEAACRGGAELVAILGGGWQPRVWENLGWFFSAVHVSGNLSVHPEKQPGIDNRHAGRVGHFTAYLNVQPQVVLSGDEGPVELVRKALAQAEEHADATLRTIAGLRFGQ